MSTMRHASVGLVLEALAAISTEKARVPPALLRCAEVMESNAQKMTGLVAGSSIASIEVAIAELRAEAAEFKRTAAHVQAQIDRDARAAEAETPALETIEGGKR